MTTEESSDAYRGLLDTSLFIDEETERPIGTLPRFGAVSVVTLAELYLGALMATDPGVRAIRLRTLTRLEGMFGVLPIDPAVARVCRNRRRGTPRRKTAKGDRRSDCRDRRGSRFTGFYPG